MKLRFWKKDKTMWIDIPPEHYGLLKGKTTFTAVHNGKEIKSFSINGQKVK